MPWSPKIVVIAYPTLQPRSLFHEGQGRTMDNACIPLTRINQHPISKAHNDLSKLRPENAPEFWLSVLAVFTVGDGKNLALIGAEGSTGELP